MTFLGLSGHQMRWMITTRKMMISSRLKSHSRCMAFGVGFQSIARTFSLNQPSTHPPHLNSSVRLATLQNITNRKGQESEVFVEDSALSMVTGSLVSCGKGLGSIRCDASSHALWENFSTMWFL